jgi:hypothetical protein
MGAHMPTPGPLPTGPVLNLSNSTQQHGHTVKLRNIKCTLKPTLLQAVAVGLTATKALSTCQPATDLASSAGTCYLCRQTYTAGTTVLLPNALEALCASRSTLLPLTMPCTIASSFLTSMSNPSYGLFTVNTPTHCMSNTDRLQAVPVVYEVLEVLAHADLPHQWICLMSNHHHPLQATDPPLPHPQAYL